MASIPAGTWSIDPVHTSVEFKVKHLGISTYSGRFNDVSGSIESSDGAITRLTGTAKTESIDVADSNLIGHLKSPDFFDAAAHPEITFSSTSAQIAGDDLIVQGDLTLRGVTKPVELKGELEGVGDDHMGNTKLGFSLEGVINRNDFGVTWNAALDNGGQVVGERVKLVLHGQAVKE